MKEEFMKSAIALAEKGRGFTNPNPLVGAVIVKNGKIIAEGWHHKLGSLHAERDALKNAAEKNVDVRGASIYVTLLSLAVIQEDNLRALRPLSKVEFRK